MDVTVAAHIDVVTTISVLLINLLCIDFLVYTDNCARINGHRKLNVSFVQLESKLL
jgi:hypothetical protein